MTPRFLADSFGVSFGKNDVLTSASMWADAGRVTVLLGRNGSGKTTLIRCALGLQRSRHGTVRFDRRLHTRPRLWRLARQGLFYLPSRDLLSRRLRLRRQLGLVTARYGRADVERALDGLAVGHVIDHFPDQMSGGEQRRAELAMAMIRRPSCLVADEPLTEVEPKDRELVAHGLRRLAEDGCAVLITGHETKDLLDCADDVIWLVAGTTHGIGAPEAAVRHDQFRAQYLGQGWS